MGIGKDSTIKLLICKFQLSDVRAAYTICSLSGVYCTQQVSNYRNTEYSFHISKMLQYVIMS